ncbi:hypothetical protein P3339_01755 [Microbulbifer sp. MLAF003]|uniref:hypothetical protein n=1 Tax=Microbulbifer sp. MLAF003 TaxID=3032582 RepID=UPI0024ACBFE0|nr:hypothetical protein [Microbulbifer sp. MLAF003]WHI51582.1 hypothetical protein P3339_01755 [Microbulbifer sp. MLAF003]
MTNPFWRFIAARRAIFRKSSYLRVTGWLESFKRGYPCDVDGNALPWMNYPVIHFLKERLSKDINVFEFGSGFSTLFYAERVSSIQSVEDNPKWFETMAKQLPDNAKVILQEADEDGEYCRSINKFEQNFQLVVVDGRDRVNCFKQSLSRLTGDGVILLDDSSRSKYSPAIDLGKSAGFKVLHFEGIKPTTTGLHRTSLFYRSENCLGL